jgi:hypothetical protein
MMILILGHHLVKTQSKWCRHYKVNPKELPKSGCVLCVLRN